MRKLLIISYHFPPDAAVGAIRPAKFAKYLSRLGWKPYVLTVREDHIPVQDHARLGDVAQLPIVRTAVWPTVLQLALECKGRLAGRTRSHGSGERAGGNREPAFSARLKRYVNSVLELPDKQIGWLIPAVAAAVRLIKAEQIDLVVTSSPPRTTALVGLLLSYAARIRLVTDLRDPWFTPSSWFRSLSGIAASRSLVRDKIEQWLERKIMERSARVVTATERHARALREAYPWLPEDRVCCIPNGYDAEDLARVEAADAAPKFTLSYLGTFYFHRTPRPLFEALSELMREGKMSPADIEVNLIGEVRSTTDGSVEELIASYGLADCVSVRPPVAYTESLRQMMRSNVLLLFAPNQCCSIPAKTFEYLAAHKPILCLAEDDGATADLVCKTGAGVVVHPGDVGAVKAAVWRLFSAFREGRSLTNGADVSRYERRALSERLSRVLIEVLRPPTQARDEVLAANRRPTWLPAPVPIPVESSVARSEHHEVEREPTF